MRDLLTELSGGDRDNDRHCENTDALDRKSPLEPPSPRRAIRSYLVSGSQKINQEERQCDDGADRRGPRKNVQTVQELRVRVQDLTRKSSATAGGSERGLEWKRFHNVPRDDGVASG